jgi:hypothetical protein
MTEPIPHWTSRKFRGGQMFTLRVQRRTLARVAVQDEVLYRTFWETKLPIRVGKHSYDASIRYGLPRVEQVS